MEQLRQANGGLLEGNRRFLMIQSAEQQGDDITPEGLRGGGEKLEVPLSFLRETMRDAATVNGMLHLIKQARVRKTPIVWAGGRFRAEISCQSFHLSEAGRFSIIISSFPTEQMEVALLDWARTMQAPRN